jgi:hypothetical protein
LVTAHHNAETQMRSRFTSLALEQPRKSRNVTTQMSTLSVLLLLLDVKFKRPDKLLRVSL